MADRGYDRDALIEAIEEAGAIAGIPPRANRKKQRDYDRELYKERNLGERFFQKLKQYRRIATRYEKLKRNYLSMLFFASSSIRMINSVKLIPIRWAALGKRLWEVMPGRVLISSS